MDKLAEYRQIVQDVLREYAAVLIANGDVQTQMIFDRENDSPDGDATRTLSSDGYWLE
jgi:XisI protein